MSEETYTDSIGWKYRGAPKEGDDCRCLVTLEQDGMVWIGLRAYDHTNKRWLNGGEPERAYVKAWMPLPPIAVRYWSRGKLLPETKALRIALRR